MLCLSGFELYSRWVPLTAVSRDLDPGSSQLIGRALLGFSPTTPVSPLLKC